MLSEGQFKSLETNELKVQKQSINDLKVTDDNNKKETLTLAKEENWYIKRLSGG